MGWRNKPALHQGRDDRLRSGYKLSPPGLTGGLPRRFTGRQNENRQGLVRLSNQGNDRRTRSFEVDPSDLQQILERGKRGNDALDERGMATEEALLRIRCVLEIRGKQKKLRFMRVSRRQGNILFSGRASRD